MNPTSKDVIMYHRSYRKLPSSYTWFLLQFLMITIPCSLITVLFYPDITRTICLLAQSILTPYFGADAVSIGETAYIQNIGNFSFLTIPSEIPSLFFSLANALICLLFYVFLLHVKQEKHLMILGMMIFGIQFAASVFFVLCPLLFPYNATDYSHLYMMQQISIWFFVPFILGFAIIPLPSSFVRKLFSVVAAYLYSLLFGTVRYIVFLFILGKVSILYMAIFFFFLGPLVDFLYIVAIYSIHIASVANKMKGHFNLWNWQYSS